MLDCDVLQADGGTRTAAITGAYVALADAIEDARAKGLIAKNAQPLTGSVAAVSRRHRRRAAPSSTSTTPRTRRAETDMNVVMTGDGRFVEVQGTAEGEPFDRDLLDALLDLATKGCADLTDQAAARPLAAAPREAHGRRGGRVTKVVLATRNDHKVERAARDPRRRQRRARARDRRPRRFPDAPDVVEDG